MEQISTQIATALTTLGINRPPGVDDGHAAYAEVRRLAFVELDPVTPATTTAETVAEDLARYALAESTKAMAQRHTADFERVAELGAREALAADADRLLDEIMRATNEPLTRVSEFAKHLTPNDTADDVVERGSRAIGAWRDLHELEEAAGALDAAQSAVELLAVLAGDTRPRKIPSRHWWLGSTENPATPESWDRSGHGRGYLAAHAAGRRLALVDVHEAAARYAAEIATEEEKRQRPAREAEKRREAKQMEKARRELAAHERLLAR